MESPLLQFHLPGTELLATAEQALALRGAFGVRRTVAAPGDVSRPHIPRAEAERGRAGHHEQTRVVPGPPVPPFTQMGADQPRPSLGRAFAAPTAGQVEQLGRPGRNRKRAAYGREDEPAGAGVGDVGSRADQAFDGQLDIDANAPA